MTNVQLDAMAPKRAQVHQRAGTKKICMAAEVSFLLYLLKSPMLHASVDHVPAPHQLSNPRRKVKNAPMHAVTAVMKAYQASSPLSVDPARRIGPAWSPASWIDHAIIANATIGSVIALTRKRGRRLRGWMRQKGNWILGRSQREVSGGKGARGARERREGTNSQKMKKQSMSCEVTPAEAGSRLGNALGNVERSARAIADVEEERTRKEGQHEMIMSLMPIPPW